MAFDPISNRVLLFGGEASSGSVTDTWAWDGTTWTQQSPLVTPGTGPGPSMAWSGDLGRVVLHENRTWLWDGAQWSQYVPTRAVGDWEGGLIADDAGRIIAYARGEVMRLSTVIASSVATGTGCPGSAGMPVLRASDRPFLGNDCFRASLAPTNAGAFAILVGGFQPASLPLGGGCTLWVGNPLLLASTVADAGGTASLALPIPSIPALRNVVLHAQAAALDPLGSLGGFATVSNALVLTLGD